MTYKDLFVKEAKAPCKLDFTSVMGPNFYAPSPPFTLFSRIGKSDGSLRYQNGSIIPVSSIPRAFP